MPLDRNSRSADGNANVEEEDHFLVSCRCESAKLLSTLLSCLDNISGSSSSSLSSFNTDEAKQARRKASSSTLQPVTVYVTAKGLSFHVYGKAKQIQSSFDMHHTMFMDYHIASMPNDKNHTDGPTPEDWQAGGEFCVNLSTVLECLHLLGTHHLERTKVSFSYETRKEVFKLEMIDEFSTFTVAAIPARIIVKSSTLHAVLSELDLVVGATRVTLSLARSTGLRLSVLGALGNCTILVPIQGSHIVSVELPSIRDEATISTKYDYPLQVFVDSMRGLDIAEETCITMNKAGMVAIQHIVFDKTLSEEPCFVDCIICSLCDDDDDDDDGEDEATTVPYAIPSPQSVAVSARTLESQAPITSKKSKVTQPEDDDGDDDQEEEEQHSTLLFGSVVGDSNTHHSRASSTHRNVRRRTRRRRRNAVDGTNDSSDDGSRDMLLDHPSDREAQSSDDETDSEIEKAATRTTILAAKRTATTRHEDCPSPELLYGHQPHQY